MMLKLLLSFVNLFFVILAGEGRGQELQQGDGGRDQEHQAEGDEKK